MELLRTHKRRSLTSEALYIFLNIGLAAVVLGVILVTQSLPLAIAVILVSKWRVLAVRPRYWAAHVQANLVDLIVGTGLVTLMYVASGYIMLQVGLAVLYVIWLLFIKPRSKRIFIVTQAGVALFVGLLALSVLTYEGWLVAQVIGGWLVGYAAARHVLNSYDEAYRSILSLMWGFMVAQFSWLFYHWTFAYSLPGFGGLKLTQGAIIIVLISFVTYKLYDNVQKYQRIRLNDLLLPVLLSASIIVVLLIAFNSIAISGT